VPLCPSTSLDLEISKDQQQLFNPTYADLLLSSVEQGSFGEEAKRIIANRHHDVIDGNAKSFSKVLNSEERMRKVTDYNEMTAGIAEISAEKDDQKRKKQEEEQKKDKEKKDAGKKAAIDKEKDEKLPGIILDVNKGEDYLVSLKVPRMREILTFYFNMPSAAVRNAKKAEVLQMIREDMSSMHQEMADAATEAQLETFVPPL